LLQRNLEERIKSLRNEIKHLRQPKPKGKGRLQYTPILKFSTSVVSYKG